MHRLLLKQKCNVVDQATSNQNHWEQRPSTEKGKWRAWWWWSFWACRARHKARAFPSRCTCWCQRSQKVRQYSLWQAENVKDCDMNNRRLISVMTKFLDIARLCFAVTKTKRLSTLSWTWYLTSILRRKEEYHQRDTYLSIFLQGIDDESTFWKRCEVPDGLPFFFLLSAVWEGSNQQCHRAQETLKTMKLMFSLVKILVISHFSLRWLESKDHPPLM